MTSKAIIESITTDYLLRFPDEQDRLAVFTCYLHAQTDAGLYRRNNFGGHITASAFIIDPAFSKMLLLKHKTLGRWLQPGGHVDTDDRELPAAALREATEETSIGAAFLHYLPVAPDRLVPFDIDSHYIPDNPKKNEDGHFHHDFRYVFIYSGTDQVAFNAAESTGLRWVPLLELSDDDTFGPVVRKLSQIYHTDKKKTWNPTS